MSMTETEEVTIPSYTQLNYEDIVPYEEVDDPNKKAHVVRQLDNPHIVGNFDDMTGQEVVNIARAMKIEIVALCGHRWIPRHNPERVDACETCIRIAGDIMNAEGH